MKRYHLEPMLSSGTTCYHLGLNVIIWDAMLSSGANVIIWDKMLSSGANVIMVSSRANVIIWCYHVMLSSGMITHPFFIFPENFTHSFLRYNFFEFAYLYIYRRTFQCDYTVGNPAKYPSLTKNPPKYTPALGCSDFDFFSHFEV